MSTARKLIMDLPSGPLDVYRKRATFDWKSFKLALEGEDSIKFQVLKQILISFISKYCRIYFLSMIYIH